MSVTITIKAKADQKRRLALAAKRAGRSLSAYVLEAATERADQPEPKADRPDYSRTAALAHGDRYIALRLVDALER
jgi:hypothetical protein